jgi:hypothetical protein
MATMAASNAKDRTQDEAFKLEEAKFLQIIYGHLEKILEKRPANPVTCFADK